MLIKNYPNYCFSSPLVSLCKKDNYYVIQYKLKLFGFYKIIYKSENKPILRNLLFLNYLLFLPTLILSLGLFIYAFIILIHNLLFAIHIYWLENNNKFTLAFLSLVIWTVLGIIGLCFMIFK